MNYETYEFRSLYDTLSKHTYTDRNINDNARSRKLTLFSIKQLLYDYEMVAHASDKGPLIDEAAINFLLIPVRNGKSTLVLQRD